MISVLGISEPRIAIVTVVRTPMVMEQAILQALAESTGELTKGRTCGQMTQPSGPIPMAMAMETTVP